MSDVHTHPRRPPPWQVFRARLRQRWLHPLLYSEWVLQNVAWFLGHWSLLEVLEYAGRFTVLVAVIVYFTEAGERRQQRHYQAWQVINTAQGKGGNGGRIDALEQLNEDRVSLTGVDVADAFLQGVHLNSAELRRAQLSSADLRDSHFRGANLVDANLHSANLRGADLTNADLSGANLSDADLSGANLTRAKLGGADLKGADLSDANVSELQAWQSAFGLSSTTILNVKNPPAGFQEASIKPFDPTPPATTRAAAPTSTTAP